MGATALYVTVHPEIVRLLISHGANVNAVCTPNERTALHEAAWRQRVETAKVLIEARANLNMKDRYGRTPLMEAAGAGKLEMVRLLVEAGADLDLRDHANQTALMLSDGDHFEEAAFLRQAGAYDDVVTAQSGVPLPTGGGPILATFQSYFRAEHARDLAMLKSLVSPEIYAASEELSASLWQQVLEITPREVSAISGYVDGDSATVTVSGPTATGSTATWEYQLARENGRWRIIRGRMK
jgi:hypothetical protein